MELALVFLLVAFLTVSIWLGLSTRTRFEGTSSLGNVVPSLARRPVPGPPLEPTARVAPPLMTVPAPMSKPASTELIRKVAPSGACLTVVEGDSKGQIISLEGVTIVGRDVSSCDIVLEDAGVSSCHARIELQGDQFVICDLASASGTYVNGSDVGRTVLMDGDVIRIGHTKFVFKKAMPEQDIGAGPEPKHEYSALVKAKLPSKMYAGDACVINLQIVPTGDMAASGLDEGAVVSSLKFTTSEETPQVEAELLAVGLSVAGELKQVKPLRLHQPTIIATGTSVLQSQADLRWVLSSGLRPSQGNGKRLGCLPINSQLRNMMA